MESEAINIDKYLGCDEDKKFDFLFDNYSILKPIIKDYKEDLISDVVDMKASNRRRENGELGVRIQVSIKPGGPTERQAMAELMIEKAIDEGYLDDTFFEYTDDQEDLIRRVTLYHTVSADYETFRIKLNTLTPEDQQVLKPYLLKQKTMDQIAKEMGIEYRSAVMRIYRIRKRLCEKVSPRLRKGA